MSDIGILNGLGGTLLILWLFGGPGLPIGALAGALIWRRHRMWGALAGAVLGFGLCLLGWLYFSDNL
jgi:Na+/proline symporter